MSFTRVALLLGLLTAIFLAIGFFFAGVAGAGVALVLAVLINFVSYWYSDKIVLSIYKAKPSDNKELHKIVKELAEKASLPMPKIYTMDMDIPNAFATGRSPKRAAVCVTRGLMEKLSEHELSGVIAHELSHIKNRDTLISTMAATIAGAVSWLGYAFWLGDPRNRNAFSFILMFVLAPIAAALVQMAISRSREYLADESGAKISNPNWLADALVKISDSTKNMRLRGNHASAHMFIVNPFSGSDFVSLFSTHPPTEKRVARLRQMKK
ncbi:MAG: zinc metalloprotease HtpX [Candidatus Aenigmatarchaeota archaeon]